MAKTSGGRLDRGHEELSPCQQRLAGNESEEPFRQFRPGSFGLTMADGCHGGSAREESRRRKMLGCLSGSTRTCVAATPKETGDVSMRSCLGEPICASRQKQGIAGGFLAPCGATVGMGGDALGWRRVHCQTTDDDVNDTRRPRTWLKRSWRKRYARPAGRRRLRNVWRGGLGKTDGLGLSIDIGPVPWGQDGGPAKSGRGLRSGRHDGRQGPGDG
jgi:hypothetical protein